MQGSHHKHCPQSDSEKEIAAELSSTIDEYSPSDFSVCFLKNHSIRGLEIVGSMVVGKQEHLKEHTVYQIEVVTDQVTYCLQRRFREFYALFKSIKRYLGGESLFPKKNYNPFVSSVSPSIIQQRTSKLNNFLQQVLTLCLSQKQAHVTTSLLSFLQLREFCGQSFQKESQKSTSEKGISGRLQSFRGHSSEKGTNSFGEHSLEMGILLINQPTNPGRHFQKLEETIKRRKFCMSREEIRLVFFGFDEYQGLLRFSVTNSLESNRIGGLQTLLDLVLPESNAHYQKYHKIFEEVSLDNWMVGDFSYLESPAFKLLYFQLLAVYCSLNQKNLCTETHILKTLFLFHQHLISDYEQWKRMNRKRCSEEGFQKLVECESGAKYNKSECYQRVQCHFPLNVYYYSVPNLLIVNFESKQSPKELQKGVMRWHRMVQGYTLNQFTSLYKYVLKFKDKQWTVRLKIQQNIKSHSKLLPQLYPSDLFPIMQQATFRMSKEHSYEIYSDYDEQIWASPSQSGSKIVILLKVAREVQIFEGSLLQWAEMLAEDAFMNLG